MKVAQSATAWFFSIGAVACICVDHKFHVHEQFQNPIAWAREPFIQALEAPSKFGAILGERLSTRDYLLEQNAQLKASNLLLEAKILKTQGLERENKELLRLLHSASFLKQDYKRVRVLSAQLERSQNVLVLDAGLNEGVATGDVVLDARGLVGIVKSAGSRHSVVMNIIEPAHALPVQIEGSNLRAIAEGGGTSGQLIMSHVPLTAKIREGDSVVTSGLGGRFPAGFPVGEVVAIERMPNNSFSQVFIQPYANLASLLDVVVVHTVNVPQAEGPSMAGVESREVVTSPTVSVSPNPVEAPIASARASSPQPSEGGA